MPRYYVGDEIHDTMCVTDDDILVDPEAVSFTYREGQYGDVKSVVPTRQGVGEYMAVVPVTKGGVTLYMRWQATNPTRAQRRHIVIEEDKFEPAVVVDYPPTAQLP